MRIAFYAPRASYLEPGVSGDKVLVRSLLSGLRERGHEVKIVSCMDVGDFWRGRVPARRLVSEAISIQKEMRHFSPEAWLVYATSVKYPDLFGWWQRPKRYVIYQTDISRRQTLPRGWYWLFAFAYRRSLGRADKIAVFRPGSADRLRSFGVVEDRLSVLPPAGRTWNWMPSREEARRHLGLPQEAPVILSVSRLTERRDDRKPGKTEMILNLLAALAPLSSDAVVVLVGDGPGRQRLEDEAAKLKPRGRVRLVGAVEDIRWFYAACDFFAFPDQQDRPRLAILEAQGCGRPVVTMHTRSAELIIDPGRTGLLAKDLEEFQSHIAVLASDRTRCESMGQAAREYVAKFHSLGTRIGQIENLLLCLSRR